MEQCVLTIGTITHALAARRALNGARIAARLIKNTRTAKKSGCAYGLEIAAADMTAAMRILDEGGIPYEWERVSR